MDATEAGEFPDWASELCAQLEAMNPADRPGKIEEVRGRLDPANYPLLEQIASGLYLWPHDLDELDGKWLTDKIELLTLRSSGGMGHVYEALQHLPGGDNSRRVAVKVMRSEYVTNNLAHSLFLGELASLAHLSDINGVVKIFDWGFYNYEKSTGGVPYFVMELLSKAIPIDQYFCDANTPDEDKLAIVAQVCTTVAHCNERKVFHGDIKPSNILVLRSTRPVLIDFGLAALRRDSSHQSQALDGAGTPGYISPEQLNDPALPPNSRTEVFALGTVLYELLTGRRLFPWPNPKPPPPIRPCGDESDALDSIVRRSIALRPEDRFDNAREMGDAIGEYLRDRAIAPLLRLHVWQWSVAIGAVFIFNLPLIRLLLQEHSGEEVAHLFGHIPNQFAFHLLLSPCVVVATLCTVHRVAAACRLVSLWGELPRTLTGVALMVATVGFSVLVALTDTKEGGRGLHYFPTRAVQEAAPCLCTETARQDRSCADRLGSVAHGGLPVDTWMVAAEAIELAMWVFMQALSFAAILLAIVVLQVAARSDNQRTFESVRIILTPLPWLGLCLVGVSALWSPLQQFRFDELAALGFPSFKAIPAFGMYGPYVAFILLLGLFVFVALRPPPPVRRRFLAMGICTIVAVGGFAAFVSAAPDFISRSIGACAGPQLPFNLLPLIAVSWTAVLAIATSDKVQSPR